MHIEIRTTNLGTTNGDKTNILQKLCEQQNLIKIIFRKINDFDKFTLPKIQRREK